MTALEAFEKIAVEDTGTAQVLPEALIQKILAITQGQPDDRDLRFVRNGH